jgi:two-component system LytT family response regulator
VARVEGKTVLIRPDEVDWIESAANYVRIHRGRETFQLRGTLASLEASLDAASFLRIHRSTIVHVDRIAHLEPYFHGDWIVTLTTGARLTLSRTYRERVEARLGRSL